MKRADLLKENDAGMGIAHCGECGERFTGQARAEVVIKATGQVKIVHADSCFDEKTMEIA